MADKRQYNSTSVTAQLSALADMKMADLWFLWDQHFKRRPGTWSRDYVVGRIAYKIQEAAYGGIDADIHRQLVRMGQKHTRLGHANSAEAMLLPGATLIRSHGGNEHRVVVTPDGQYEYKGQVFKSLSMVARHITGTHWSGPAFFGLKKSSKASKAAGGDR
jgi:hypothetical protein